jgi:enoyl-CoA hydratase/carnithine racemase
MNRPEKKNALDAKMFGGLLTAPQRVHEDRSVRAAVLSGAGDCFCAGLDVANFGAMVRGDLDANSESVAEVARALSADGANRAQ